MVGQKYVALFFLSFFFPKCVCVCDRNMLLLFTKHFLILVLTVFMNGSQCYYDTSKVTDELVEKILLPGLEPGALDVFLDFICYSGGPLPEELLPQVKVRHHLCVSSNVFFSSCSSLVAQINSDEVTDMIMVKIENLNGLIRLALCPK